SLGATRSRVLVKSGLCLSLARHADELGAARARARGGYKAQLAWALARARPKFF
ncbi:hypothetical protein A2U01_0104737, partial [Trifolium medium]|nr:hypothetical protein [Trifolium medium]